MNERNFISQTALETGAAPGHHAPDPDYDWYVRDRAFVELVTRYARLGTWLFALLGALLFFSVAASVAAFEFGMVSVGGDGGQELFSRGAADRAEAPPEVWP